MLSGPTRKAMRAREVRRSGSPSIIEVGDRLGVSKQHDWVSAHFMIDPPSRIRFGTTVLRAGRDSEGGGQSHLDCRAPPRGAKQSNGLSHPVAARVNR